MEAVTFSFLAPKEAALFGGGAAALTLVNPISADLSASGRHLPNLLQAAGRNQDRGRRIVLLLKSARYFWVMNRPISAACAGIRHGIRHHANGTQRRCRCV